MSLGRDILYAAGLTLTAPVWGYRLISTGKWRTDWAGRLGKVPHSEREATTDRRTILIHGVSVGEVNLIRTLVDELARRDSALRLVIASTTNTGFARAEQLYGDRFEVVRYPLDFSFAVRRFLDVIRPDLVASVELEVWPHFVEACNRRGIPFCIVNGRLSKRSFARYRKFRWLLSRSFDQIDHAAVQTEEYAERFQELGTPDDRVSVFDTMKWDTAKIEDPTEIEGANQLAAELGIDRSRPLIVAGSTGPGEDELLIRDRPEDAQLLIAPRKPEWFDAVMKVAPDAVRRTSGETRATDVYLLDTIGELRQAYALADVCIVGRSFMGDLYGSDPMEPIGLGKPTIIGVYHSDFWDVVKAFSMEAGICIVNRQPCRMASELLNQPEFAAKMAEAGQKVIRERQGATQRHADMLFSFLNSSDTSPT